MPSSMMTVGGRSAGLSGFSGGWGCASAEFFGGTTCGAAQAASSRVARRTRFIRYGCKPGRRSTLVLEDLAALHYEPDVLETGDVLQRIAVDGDEVGEAAGGDLAEVPGLSQERGAHRGGALDGLHRAHAVADHVAELLGLALRPGEAPRVGAEGDARALAHGLGEGLLLQLDHLRPDAAAPLGDVHPDVDGRAPEHVLLDHPVDQVVGER